MKDKNKGSVVWEIKARAQSCERQEQGFNYVRDKKMLHYVKEWLETQHNKEGGYCRWGKCRRVHDLKRIHDENQERQRHPTTMVKQPRRLMTKCLGMVINEEIIIHGAHSLVENARDAAIQGDNGQNKVWQCERMMSVKKKEKEQLVRYLSKTEDEVSRLH